MSEETTPPKEVTLETVKGVLEGLRGEHRVLGYVVFEGNDDSGSFKKVLSCGGIGETETEATTLLNLLKALGGCLNSGEVFKRLSVEYPDCIYYALIIGQYRVSDNMSDSLDGNRFVNPEPVINGKLSNSQINQWRKSGYCLVDGLLDADEIEDVLETSRQVLSERDSNLKATFGSAGYLEFPTTYKPVNNMTLNERIITSCEQLLGSTDLLLTQADIWKKRGTEKTGPEDHADQRIHMDYVNNTLLHPPCWDEPEAVSIIIYYSDADECGGRTAVLPKKSCDDPNYKWPYVHMPGMVGTDWANDKSCAEKIIRDFDPNVADFRNQLYQQEKYVNYNKGTILFYRLDVWHRGTPISPNKERFVQNLVFKKKDSSWLNQWNQGTARHMYLPGQIVENMIAKCSLKQRQVLGFPPPGHPHWTNDMINAVEARYSPHGMDVAPYRDALVDLNTTS